MGKNRDECGCWRVIKHHEGNLFWEVEAKRLQKRDLQGVL